MPFKGRVTEWQKMKKWNLVKGIVSTVKILISLSGLSLGVLYSKYERKMLQ